MSFFEFLSARSDDMLQRGIEHAVIVGISVLIATVLGVLIGILAFRVPRLRIPSLAITGTFLTIPSFALFVLMIPLVGLGSIPVVITLTMYGLLPVVRNTITGLSGVDPAIVESAQGMGYSAQQLLMKIQLPIAWPVIMTGIRVTTIMLVGIAAIGAVVLGPGYGNMILAGRDRTGTDVGLNLVLAGIIGVIVVAVVFDFLFSLIGRLTTSKGLR